MWLQQNPDISERKKLQQDLEEQFYIGKYFDLNSVRFNSIYSIEIFIEQILENCHELLYSSKDCPT